MDIRDEKINKIYEILGKRLADIIEMLAYNDNEKDKLIYRACLNDEEKINYTKAELKKCQDEILDCDVSFAPYVSSIIYDFHMPNIDERLPIICTNYMVEHMENLGELFVDDYENVDEIENDDFLNYDFEFEGEDFAYEQLFIYVKHFFYMGYRIFLLKSLFEDVENTNNESQKNTPQNDTNQVIIADNNFEKFKTDLEYNYPFEHAPMVYFQKWKTNLSHFKKEVLNNITNLSTERRIPFLNKLLFELEEMLDGIQVTKEELDELYLQHNTSEYDIFKKRDFKNSLHIAIHSEPAEFENHFKGGFDPMSETYQFTFYNYHYGQTINNAIIFLKEQLESLNSNKEQHNNVAPTYKIIETEFNDFRANLAAHFMFREASLFVYEELKNQANKVKSEILNNLQYISNSINKEAYLHKIIHELNIHSEDFKQTKEGFEEFIACYNSNLEKIIVKKDINDTVFKWLIEPMPREKNSMEPNFNYDIIIIHDYFRDYTKGHFIKELVTFTEKLLGNKQELKSNNDNPINRNKEVENITPENKKVSNIKSFEYISLQTEHENITNLLKELKRLNLVDQVTELKHFRTVFTNKEVLQKINWTGNISELAFFIKTIHNTSKKVKDTKQRLWEITVNCFQMDNGSILEQSKLRGQKKPATSSEIEKVINDYL